MADCQVEIPQQDGLDDGVMTVGRVFKIHCHGSFPKIENLEKWAATLDAKENPKTLKVFSLRFATAEEIEVTGTSYVAGHHDIPDLKIQFADQNLFLGHLVFDVQSVIDKQNSTVEPFGPVALRLGWPKGLWIGVGILVALVCGTIFLKLRRRYQRNTLLEELRQHDSAQTPLAEVHQTLRRWRREHPFFYGHESTTEEIRAVLSEVDRAFRLFLVRTFRIPALTWKDRLILREFKKRHKKIFQEFGPDIKRFFNEIVKAHQAPKLHGKDVVQLAESFRKTAEKLDKANGRTT